MIEFLLALISVGSLFGILYHLINKFSILFKYKSVNLQEISQDSEGVSILICIKDEEPQFHKYLPRILEQEYNLFEVVIVYEGNHPQMRSFLDSIKDNEKVRLIDITSIDSPFLGKKKALHYGLLHCHYDLILTTDGDCYPESKHWITQMVSNKLGHKIVLGVSPYISDSTWLNRWIRYDNMMVSLFYVSYTMSCKAYMGMGRNMLFEKSIWTQKYVNTFAKYSYGDDDMLVQSIHQKDVTVMLDSFVYSYPINSWQGWFYQKLRHLKIAKNYNYTLVKDLAIYPLCTVLFWCAIWVWAFFYKFHVIWILIVLIFVLTKMFIVAMIEFKLKIKNKVWFMSPIFDLFYALMQLVFPFLTLVHRVKWK